MILTGPGMCLPSQATVQELFSVARDAGVIPDISLDPILTTFLSLDSSAALQHQYTSLKRSMSREQQSAFGLRLTEKLGGSRVTHGRVGVVALALSMLFDQVAQQVTEICCHYFCVYVALTRKIYVEFFKRLKKKCCDSILALVWSLWPLLSLPTLYIAPSTQ